MWSLGEVQFSPTKLTISEGEVPDFSRSKEDQKSWEEEQKLESLMAQLEKGVREGDRSASFNALNKLNRSSSITLRKALDENRRPALRTHLMVGLSQKAEKKDANYLERIYYSMASNGERRFALMGLAKSNPEKAVEIIRREIFGKKKSSIIWKLYALQALYRARIKPAQKLLEKLSNDPSPKISSKAKRFAGYLKRRAKYYSARSREVYNRRKRNAKKSRKQWKKNPKVEKK